MPYAMPAQFNNAGGSNSQAPDSAYVQQQPAGERARRNLSQAFPGSTLLDMEQDGNGRPVRAHIRDVGGNDRTVDFDGDQCVDRSQ